MIPSMYEHFIVKHYTEREGPVFKGNGFDGIRVGDDREEAEELAAWINQRLDEAHGYPDQLLDVAAICNQRDQYLEWIQAAEDLLRTAPIHHYGKDYERWDARRKSWLSCCSVRTTPPSGGAVD